MKIRIEDDYTRILVLFDDEKAECIVCHEEKHDRLYYCQQDGIIYCKNCMLTGKACKNRMDEHTDLKIDRVEKHITAHMID